MRTPNVRFRQRRVRRVVAQPPRPPLAHSDATAWLGGLEAAVALNQLCPTTAALVAGRPATPGLLVRIGEAVLGVIHGQLPLHMDYELPIRAVLNPAAYLREPIERPESAAWLTYLVEINEELGSLCPEGFGVGLTAFFDDTAVEPSLLTLALWRLLHTTDWGTGVDWNVLLDHDDGLLDDSKIARLERLRPLPRAVDIDALCQTLTVPRWPYRTPPGQLVAYALERTDNPLANLCNHPAHMYPTTMEWRELGELLPLAPEAKQIERDYAAWAKAIDADPGPQLRSLARALATAATEQLNRRRAASVALIDLVLP